MNRFKLLYLQMSNHFPLDEQPFRSLYYLRGDEQTMGGSYCVGSAGRAVPSESLSWARESQHNPSIVEPQYGAVVKASLRPHFDRTAIAGGVTQECQGLRFGATAVKRSGMAIEDAPVKPTLLVKAFQEGRFFKQTTEQLRLAGRVPTLTSYADYGKNAYAVRAHVSVPWLAKNVNH